MGVGSFSMTAEVSTKLHDLVVSAPGYQSDERAVSFDRPNALVIALEAEEAPEEKPVAASKPAHTKAVKPKAEPKPQEENFKFIKRPGKKPRNLDPNPFNQ